MTDPRHFDRRIETNRQLNPDSGADTPPASFCLSLSLVVSEIPVNKEVP
jgi:hypothetical protein